MVKWVTGRGRGSRVGAATLAPGRYRRNPHSSIALLGDCGEKVGDGNAGVPDQAAESSAGYFLVVRHGQARVVSWPDHDDVISSAGDFPAQDLKRAHDLGSAQHRKS